VNFGGASVREAPQSLQFCFPEIQALASFFVSFGFTDGRTALDCVSLLTASCADDTLRAAVSVRAALAMRLDDM